MPNLENYDAAVMRHGIKTQKNAQFGGAVTFDSPVTFNAEVSGIGLGSMEEPIEVEFSSFMAGEDTDRNVMRTESQNGYFHISTAGDHLVKTGSGYLSHILVTGGAAGTITAYDSPTAPGTIIASFDSTNAIATYTLNCLFSEALVIRTSANTKLTVFSS